MTGAFAGKTILVTGAGRGIGRATALRLAGEGARLVLVDTGGDREGRGGDAAVVEEVSLACKERGGQAIGIAEDISAPGVAETCVARAVETFGGIDGAFGSAGIVRERLLVNLDDEDAEALWRVHVFGAFALVRAVSRALTNGKRAGSIVVSSSPTALFGVMKQSVLSATHAAVIGLVRSAAAELKMRDIRINAIAPLARTRLTEDLPTFQGIREDSMSPDHVASVVAFLLSDVARDVQGEVVGVAGSRVYALRTRETPGIFSDGAPFSMEALASQWREVTKG